MLTLTALIVIPGLVICLAGGVRFGYALAGAIPVSYGVVAVASYLLGMLELRWNLLSYIVATLITAVAVAIVGAFASGRLRFTRRRWFLRFRFRLPRRDAGSAGDAADPAGSAGAAGPSHSRSRRSLRAASRAAERAARAAELRRAPELRGWRIWVWNCAPFLGVIVAAWIIASLVINLLSYAPDGLTNVFQGWDAHWHANYLRFIADTGLASPDDAGLLQNQETQA
ncbi:DUF6541 family protein, partial [Dietzia sp.]|uniref:DUF6541 family protein n=1 Tax=Dietzia sp. TaxID=1871616 RepID=UPI002FDAF807